MDWVWWAFIGIISANVLFFGILYIKYLLDRRDEE